MSGLSRFVGGVVNRFLRPAGYQLVPVWVTKVSDPASGIARFSFNGAEFPYTAHHHNCGWPPGRTTERTVELSLADRWLDVVDVDRVVEVGAVTPYYWPGRVRSVVDPADPHKLVTDRRSVTELDLSRDPLLSISTFEHFGVADYGLAADPGVLHRAFAKLFDESPKFLVTAATGYNPDLDRLVFDCPLPRDVNVGFMVRDDQPWSWRQEHDPGRARVRYGNQMANGVIILERGQVLFPPSDPAKVNGTGRAAGSEGLAAANCTGARPKISRLGG